MNSTMTRQVNVKQAVEFFHHEDNEYIIRSFPNHNEYQYDTEGNKTHNWEIRVYKINGKRVQTVNVPPQLDATNIFQPISGPKGINLAFISLGPNGLNIKVYKIGSTRLDQGKKKRNKKKKKAGEESDDEEEKTTDIITFDMVNDYTLANKIQDGNYIFDTSEMNKLIQGEENTEKIFLDDEENLMILQVSKQCFFINEQQMWVQINKQLRHCNHDMEAISHVYLANEIIYVHYSKEKVSDSDYLAHIGYTFSRWAGGLKLAKVKDLTHHIYKGSENTLTFQGLIPTREKTHVIIHYNASAEDIHQEIFVVWNIHTAMEEFNFVGREGDRFINYINGKSKYGYLVFQDYIVNLDNGLVNPFYVVGNENI